MDKNETFGSGYDRDFSKSENTDRGSYSRRDGGYDNRSNNYGERPRYTNRYDNNGERPRYSSRPSYGQDGQERPRYTQRTEGGERPRYTNRYDNNGERPRYTSRPSYGQESQERPRYTQRPEGQDRPRYTGRPSYGQEGQDRPRYTQRPEGQDRPRYSQRPEGQDRPRYNSRPSYGQGNDRPRYNSYNNDGEQRPRYNSRPSYGQEGDERPRYNSRPSYGQPRQGGYGRPQNARPAFGKPKGRPMPGKGAPKGKGKKSPEAEMAKKIEFAGDWFTNTENAGENFVVANSTTNPSTKMRLNRFIAMAGVCSRREADNLIANGQITVNGQVVTEMGVVLKVGDVVEYNGKVLKAEKLFYVLLNKPKDTVTTTDDPEGRRTVMDLVSDACEERIFPVGRLDRNTTGVLLLTNDGELTEHLTHPRYGVRKIYHVFLDKNVTEADMELMLRGFELEDGEIHVDDVRYVDGTDHKQVGVQIHSGRNRIVRRIFEHLGYEVEKLDRVYFAGLTKVNVPRGKWRFLEEQEINKLKAGFFK